MNIERGGVCLAALDPVVGKEIAKTRPVVVVRVKANQIRTLDKSRLIKFLGDMGEENMREIEKAVKVHLDLA